MSQDEWKKINWHYSTVEIDGRNSEAVAECTICWALVVDSSKRLHHEWHKNRNEVPN